MIIKTTFILKCGKTVENISELTTEELKKIVETVRTSFREGLDGCITLEDCCIRLSECAYAEWELMSDEVQLQEQG